jgi:D-arabinan exo alpha-(1,3)/(1,5)-arabinofuranosidase (non-reducing end)
MDRLASSRLLILCAAVLSGALRACEPCITDGSPPEGTDVGVRDMTAWDALPVVRAIRYNEFSSYDRLPNRFSCLTDPGNKDFNNFMAVCGLPGSVAFAHIDDSQPGPAGFGKRGYVIAASDDGPGYISRIWLGQFGLSALLTEELFNENETVTIYVDDFCEPVYQGRIKDWETGSSAPFTEPLVGCRSGGYVSYVPISFQSRVLVLLDNLSPTSLYYYNVDIQKVYEETVPFSPANFTEEGQPGVEEDLRRLFGQLGENPNEGFRAVELPLLTLPPGGLADVASFDGYGTIKLLQCVFPDVTLDQLRDIDLRITWDDVEPPAVDVPLSAFFGVHLALESFKTLPMRVQQTAQGLELACYFPMPFDTGALIQLLNHGATPVELLPTLGLADTPPEGDWGHFHARFNSEEAPLPPGATYPVADIQGRGKYVGTFLFLEGHADVPHLGNLLPEHPLNCLEGDASGFIDGVWRIRGTGTEDYLNGALYFRTGKYDYGFSGVNHKVSAGRWGRVSGYRWHILSDEIHFYRSFELELEYGQGRPNTVERYQSVAYYYLTPESR